MEFMERLVSATFHVKHFGKAPDAGKVPRETLHSPARNRRGFKLEFKNKLTISYRFFGRDRGEISTDSTLPTLTEDPLAHFVETFVLLLLACRIQTL